MNVTATIIWTRHDEPGHETSRLISHNNGWELAGTAVFDHEGDPVELTYSVLCDKRFHTRTGAVTGWIGRKPVRLQIEADENHNWRMNGTLCPEVTGCIDLDLNFTPSTNLLQMRRLTLPLDEAVRVRTAWLSFPDLKLQFLEQVYRRTGPDTFAYESPALDFRSTLRSNKHGFITEYPPLWTTHAAS
jgi:hypothetical protein